MCGGTGPHDAPVKSYSGSIPACAGEPLTPQHSTVHAEVYPRVCGGTRGKPLSSAKPHGLSPRVRGNLPFKVSPVVVQGSIPACAGEPSLTSSASSSATVYPRVCGGTDHDVADIFLQVGLSPRVRGNQFVGLAAGPLTGSIPACAGEPMFVALCCDDEEVYPRVCGGTGPGLGSGARLAVYPRVCGGTRTKDRPPRHADGLSPRVRGNPSLASISPSASTVYPRVCGGTPPRPPLFCCPNGLSPRVRGNLFGESSLRRRLGSIPACAGEPHRRLPGCGSDQVYPRVCGGTGLFPLPALRRRGLSPRVRGNPAERRDDGNGEGSIPACAGEPKSVVDPPPPPRSIPACAGEPGRGASEQAADRVYPRVCGGTARGSAHVVPCQGLSPRVRGNPGINGFSDFRQGSIPACAGEPRRGWECP